MSDQLTIGGETFSPRLMPGTGKHRSPGDLIASVEASDTEIITIAIGRLNLDDPDEKTIGTNIKSFRTPPVLRPRTRPCSPPTLLVKLRDLTGSRSK
jgi:thiazole synthase ThiGH ThiG subunit